MLGALFRGVFGVLGTITMTLSSVDFLLAARGATGMVDVMVRPLMPWLVNFEDEACWYCALEMMKATAVGRAGGALFSLTPSKIRTYPKTRHTIGISTLVGCQLENSFPQRAEFTKQIYG